MDPEVDRMLADYAERVKAKMKMARASGAISDDATDVELARCAMVLTAEDYSPMSPFGKNMLANLRHFI